MIALNSTKILELTTLAPYKLNIQPTYYFPKKTTKKQKRVIKHHQYELLWHILSTHNFSQASVTWHGKCKVAHHMTQHLEKAEINMHFYESYYNFTPLDHISHLGLLLGAIESDVFWCTVGNFDAQTKETLLYK